MFAVFLSCFGYLGRLLVFLSDTVKREEKKERVVRRDDRRRHLQLTRDADFGGGGGRKAHICMGCFW